MKTHGQFCSVARALELLGERWTLLIVRELLCGSRRFGDIRRGVPRISRTMLVSRLRTLEDAGVLRRVAGPAYELTEAGLELEPLVATLGVWGQRWLPRTLPPEHLDIEPLLWDVRRRVRFDALPDEPLVVRFELSDGPPARRRRYLLLRRTEASPCDHNPGYPEKVVVHTDRATLVAWWRGDLELAEAKRSERLRLEGDRRLVRAFPTWFDRYLFAGVAPAKAS